MQQVGGALGLSVLVTIFGTASRNEAKHAVAGAAGQVQVFVHAADTAFLAAAVLMALSVLMVASMRSKAQDKPATHDADELAELEAVAAG
jgi:hypothetical protein